MCVDSTFAIQLYNKSQKCIRLSSDPPYSQGILEGDGDYREDIQIKVTEDSLFYCSYITLCPTSAHILHPARCLDTKGRVDDTFFVFFSHVLPNFKVRLVSPNCRVEADWLKMHHITNLSYFVGHPIYSLSHNPCTPATKVAMWRNSQNEQNGR